MGCPPGRELDLILQDCCPCLNEANPGAGYCSANSSESNMVSFETITHQGNVKPKPGSQGILLQPFTSS